MYFTLTDTAHFFFQCCSDALAIKMNNTHGTQLQPWKPECSIQSVTLQKDQLCPACLCQQFPLNVLLFNKKKTMQAPEWSFSQMKKKYIHMFSAIIDFKCLGYN